MSEGRVKDIEAELLLLLLLLLQRLNHQRLEAAAESSSQSPPPESTHHSLTNTPTFTLPHPEAVSQFRVCVLGSLEVQFEVADVITRREVRPNSLNPGAYSKRDLKMQTRFLVDFVSFEFWCLLTGHQH